MQATHAKLDELPARGEARTDLKMLEPEEIQDFARGAFFGSGSSIVRIGFFTVGPHLPVTI